MHEIPLTSKAQAREALRKAWEWAAPRLERGERLSLAIGEPKRNDPQNRKLHASIAEIAKTVEWAGRKWDAEVWKRLLVAAWLRAHNQQMILVPAIDGAGVDAVFRRTSQLTKAECADLQDFIHCWGALQGVEFND
jgi:hypothetical protein